MRPDRDDLSAEERLLSRAFRPRSRQSKAHNNEPANLTRVCVLVLAGGGGTRGWPISTTTKPKQLQAYTQSGRTLLQETVWRLQRHEFISPEQVYVMTTAPLAAPVREQLASYDVKAEHLIVEPALAETGAAIGYAAKLIERETPNATLLVLSADHIVRPVRRFQDCLLRAVRAAQAEPCLVVIGIAPTRPDPNFGYHLFGRKVGHQGVFTVEHTVEKPDPITAGRYVGDGRYYWDSGMFAWDVGVILAAFKRSAPEYFRELERIGQALGTATEQKAVEQAYRKFLTLKQARAGKASIDYLVLEKEDKVGVKAALFWVDVGNLGEPIRQLYHLPRASSTKRYIEPAPSEENLILGSGKQQAVVIDSQCCNLFVDKTRRLFVKGVKELVVADTIETGATAIYPIAQAGDVKALVGALAEDEALAGYCRGGISPGEGHAKFIDSEGTVAFSDGGLAAGVGVQDHVLIRYKFSAHVFGAAYKAEGTFLSEVAMALQNSDVERLAALIDQPLFPLDRLACLLYWAERRAPLAIDALLSYATAKKNAAKPQDGN